MNKLVVVFFLLASTSSSFELSGKAPSPREKRIVRDVLKRNPFDRRPGATVGKLQVALANGNWQASKMIGDAARKMNGNTAQGLADFIEKVCTDLCRLSSDWLYAAEEHDVFGGGAVENSEHERYYNMLVNKEAAKFDKEYMPTAADMEAEAKAQPGGICVVSVVAALEGDLEDIFRNAPSSVRTLNNALTDLAGAAQINDGYNLYNAEVLWTPSSPDETLLREDAILDFPELILL